MNLKRDSFGINDIISYNIKKLFTAVISIAVVLYPNFGGVVSLQFNLGKISEVILANIECKKLALPDAFKVVQPSSSIYYVSTPFN
jgi:hypothetical protein